LNRKQHSTKHLKTNKMKNLFKFAIVACGFVFALTATSNKSKASAPVAAAGEGCRESGECGTTPGGVKLNGSYSVWAD
jgi:hypothetical protein